MTEFHLLNTIAIALCVACAGGVAARLARLPAIAGYLVAGLIISPFTPGYEADTESLREMAELGVIFLMFGVGLHFNVKDLLAVRNIAVPGAIVQVAATVGICTAGGVLFGMPLREGLVLGLAISVASTVVLIRALEDRRMLDSIHGRVAVGWLVVQDLITVLILVLIPTLAPGGGNNLVSDASVPLAKAAAFLAIMFTVGAWAVPRVLGMVARLGSRELFILAIVALALAIATSASLFGLSVAIGAFIAGVVISETEMSHQAAADVIPLRDAFAVLFFVTVGMLLDPELVLDHLGLLGAVLAVVLVGKGLLALLVAAVFPYPARTALTVAAGGAQVGEFSFIVADEAMAHSLMSSATYNAILAAAVISIALNPLAFGSLRFAERMLSSVGPFWRLLDRQGPPPSMPRAHHGHVIIAGYGRVGELTGHALGQLGIPFVVVEASIDRARQLGSVGIPVVWGDAANVEVLRSAGAADARLLVVAVPDESTAALALANAGRLRDNIPVIVRARHAAEVADLRALGAAEVVVPEYEGGIELLRQTLIALDLHPDEVHRFAAAIRDIHYDVPAPAYGHI